MFHDESTIDLGADSSGFPPRKPIGRYRVQRLLGEGGFGCVYLAFDEQLNRPVAVKTPHARLVSHPGDAEAYLREARTVARLDHGGIVPVYDCGATDDFPCYVVSKYIDGTDLARWQQRSRVSPTRAAELVASVAEALHYARQQGIVHRDIKPGNILLDGTGKPYVADFGLALREQDVGKGPRFAGTPAYMSPEQARGEGHRVDGRSDIFSLGVVLYELLTGRRPFRGETRAELLESINAHEPKPPRQFDDQIAKELERICLKALAKRASERYTTAKDLADDLRHYGSQHAPPDENRAAASAVADCGLGIPEYDKPSSTPHSPLPTPRSPSDSKPITIVPRGLRSFDEHDADFFLELLPGARDRDGLPESLRFWKTRIEEVDADRTFPVGLLYGPSGCGKSSLVKAGLLPHLGGHVLTSYIEATPDETEIRLLRALRKRCPALPEHLELKPSLSLLRRGECLPAGKKVLLLLDQFEQWLHAKSEDPHAPLIEALRQCDGGRLQCVVLLRDDFWMAATRFFRDLEIRLVEGHNSAAVDLFDLGHARKVLAAFGQAFGRLPERSPLAHAAHAPDAPEAHGTAKDRAAHVSRSETATFLDQAISGLAEEGKVVPVRLALFAEMMQGKPWTPEALEQVGGAAGIGATFLEETFSAKTAPPEHRYHQKAARAVLSTLLPAQGTDIRGNLRTRDELLAASGYTGRQRDFDDLLRILDSEVRLITPTDSELPNAGRSASVPQSEVRNPQSGYQLTHDYLVPSLRDWLTRKQRETRRGRAELRLAELSVFWNAKPENRRLPALGEDLGIRLFTRRKDWSLPQRKMMRKAAAVHSLRAGMLIVTLVTIAFAIMTAKEQWAENARLANDATKTAQKVEDLRKEVEEQKWRDYFNHIATAQREWETGDPSIAWDELNACSRDLRGWEHNYLFTLFNAAGIGKNRHGVKAHQGPIAGIAFSPDGKRFVTASYDNTLKVWDAATGKQERVLAGHTDRVASVAFRRDGKQIVSGSLAHLKLWDAETGAVVGTLVGHKNFVTGVAFDPDGKRIVSGSEDGKVIVWDAVAGQMIRTLEGHTAGVTGVAFSPDGTRIVSGSWDRTARLWDAETGQEIGAYPASSAVLCVAFRPDGKSFVSGAGRTLALWNVADAQAVPVTLPSRISKHLAPPPDRVFSGHEDRIFSVAFSPDGKEMASGSADKAVKLWNVETGKEFRTLKGHRDVVFSVAFSPDDTQIASGSWDGTWKLQDRIAARDTRTLEHTAVITSVAISHDGGRIVSGAASRIPKLWDTKTGEDVLGIIGRLTQHVEGHADRISSVAFSPDGKRFLTGSFDKTLKLWDARTGQCTRTFKAHEDRVTSVAFSPNGERIVSGSEDTTLIVWDVATGQPTPPLGGHKNSVTSVAFSPDGERVVSGSADTTLILWDLATGQPAPPFQGHSDRVASVAFSPDGSQVVSASEDGTLKVWSAKTGQEMYTLQGHAGTVNCVAFSPDGKRVVSGGQDRTLKLWDAESGRLTLTLKAHLGSVTAVVFSSDGNWIVSGSEDRTVRIWDASSRQEPGVRY